MNSNSTAFDRSQIEEIKQRLDIEDIVKEYVNLKPVGRNLFGLCPFHKEDSPSFSVNSELGIFKCFGCGETGDVFQFLMKIENMEFREALEKLAKQAGVTLKQSSKDKKQNQLFSRAREANRFATKFFHHILMKHEIGQTGRDYIKTRKLTTEILDAFQVGYGPPYNPKVSLIQFLQKKGYKPKELVTLGLAKEYDNRIVDKFVDRIVFPIFDTNGNIIGFSGRIIKANKKRPKYLNTSETIIFKKRQNLFGLYQAKKEIREKDFVILVEGQTDVLSSFQVGIKNIVAPLGTSLTDLQLERLKRFTRNIALSFDNDAAGITARLRASQLGYEKGFNVEAIEIPKGKDADECIKISPDLWKQAVKSKVPAITYFLTKISMKYDPTSLKGKQKIVEYIIPLLEKIGDKMIQDHHIKEISLKTGITEGILRNYIKTPSKKRFIEKEILHTRKILKDSISKEQYLLSLLTQYPEVDVMQFKDQLADLDFQSNETKEIIKTFISKENNRSDKIFSELTPEQQLVYEDAKMRLMWNNEPAPGEIQDEIKNTINIIRKQSLQRQIKDLKEQISNLEKLNKSEEASRLQEKQRDLIEDLNKIQIH